MKEVKIIFKRMLITIFSVFIYGIIFQIKYVYIGCTSGCLVALLNFYLLSKDVKNITFTRNIKYAKRVAFLGYLKRYFIYMAYLGGLIYFLGFDFFVSGVIGLFAVRFNIYILIISEKIKNFYNKCRKNDMRKEDI